MAPDWVASSDQEVNTSGLQLVVSPSPKAPRTRSEPGRVRIVHQRYMIEGVSQVITRETGFLVPPLHSTPLAKSMCRLAMLMQDERAELGAVARTRAVTTFNLQRVVDSREKLYLEGLAAARGRCSRFASGAKKESLGT